jgi:transmembrane sensor
MEDTRAYYLASRLHDGIISATERTELDRWIAADPARSNFLDEVAQILGPVSNAVNIPVTTTDSDWLALRQALGAPEQAAPKVARVIPIQRAPQRSPMRYAVAAAVALLVAFGAYWMLQGGKEAAGSPTTYATKDGERREIALPDGSKVMLGGGSQLVAAAGFSREHRQLSLTGEAYFEVKKDPAHPFEVTTGGVKTTVLGTQFNLRAYQPDISVSLSVVEGKVNFAPLASGAGQIFVANESGNFDAQHGTVLRTAVLPSDAAAWRENVLVFADTPLQEAVSRINHFYDIDIRLGSGLQDARLTTRLVGDDEAAMLDVLATTYQASVRRAGKTVWLEK